MNTFQEAFDASMKIIEKLGVLDSEYVSIDLKAGSADIAYFPSDERKAEVTRQALALFGKLEKSQSGGTMTGAKDGVQLRLFGVLTCKIVGYKTVSRPKVVELEETEETQEPIYECLSPLA